MKILNSAATVTAFSVEEVGSRKTPTDNVIYSSPEQESGGHTQEARAALDGTSIFIRCADHHSCGFLISSLLLERISVRQPCPEVPMLRFLLLPFTVPAERLVGRVRRLRASFQPTEAHAPTASPRFDHVAQGAACHDTTERGLLLRILLPRDRDARPNDPSRRDSMRAAVGFPLTLFFLSAAAGSGATSCAASGASSLAVTEVDTFTIGHTSEDGMTLQDALVARARELGINLAWHQSTAPDQFDAATSVEGTRLVRWDYRSGSSTDSRHYLFEVYQEDGEPIGNEPELTTVLRRGYSVVVLEVSSLTA